MFTSTRRRSSEMRAGCPRRSPVLQQAPDFRAENCKLSCKLQRLQRCFVQLQVVVAEIRHRTLHHTGPLLQVDGFGLCCLFRRYPVLQTRCGLSNTCLAPPLDYGRPLCFATLLMSPEEEYRKNTLGLRAAGSSTSSSDSDTCVAPDLPVCVGIASWAVRSARLSGCVATRVTARGIIGSL